MPSHIRATYSHGHTMSVVVRRYGLLDPINWDVDCFEHLYLQKKFWNRLVEIDLEYRHRYRAIVNSDKEVASIQTAIEAEMARIFEMGTQRRQLGMLHCKKSSLHTSPLDNAIKASRAELKKIAISAKEIRTAAKGRVKELTIALEADRMEEVKQAYKASGLWWGNYNAVIKSYNTARSRAIKEGGKLRFQNFDGSGRFTCQIFRGMSTEDLLSGKNNVAQIRKITSTEFTEVIGSNTPAPQLQSAGSRRDKREYGILAITVYTGENEAGTKSRRTLDFPIILHRPLPVEVTLKTLTVNRRKVGTDFRWSVTFTYTNENSKVVARPSARSCRINFGWQQVAGGLQMATINDGAGAQHIILPQVIIDKLAYCKTLQDRITAVASANHAWLLEKMATPPEALKGEVAALRRDKRLQPEKFARLVIKWRTECPDFEPQALAEADVMRKRNKILSEEYHHLCDKVRRRRLEFYRTEAKKIAYRYSLIRVDTMDIRQKAVFTGMPDELAEFTHNQREVAALSVLHQWIRKQAAKSGSTVETTAVEISPARCGVREGTM